MNSFYIDLGFSVLFTVLKQAIKNPKSKAEVRASKSCTTKLKWPTPTWLKVAR